MGAAGGKGLNHVRYGYEHKSRPGSEESSGGRGKGL